MSINKFHQEIRETYSENPIYTNQDYFRNKFDEIIDYQLCPNCGGNYLEGKGCFDCGNGVLISGEFDILPDYDDLLNSEIKKQNSAKKIITLEKKLNFEEVKYLNQPNKLDPKKSIIFLTIGDKKYKIGFNYEVNEFHNFNEEQDNSYKTANNLRINFIQIKNGRTFKKTFVHYFKELNEYILKEILNNPQLNNFLK